MRRGERPVMSLPAPLLVGFAVLLLLQIFIHHQDRAGLSLDYQTLDAPLDLEFYQGLAMGSEQLLGYLLAIRVQLHDSQAGRHFLYSQIDYNRLIEWLNRVTELSPGTEYPMLLASRVYTTTKEPGRLRLIIGFIQQRFEDDPELHWRHMAEASVVAKHRLGDLELALAIAEKLARQPAELNIPRWARDIQFLLLAELNELESSIAIIESLLRSDAVYDPDEQRFLESKLLDFQQKLFESQQSMQN